MDSDTVSPGSSPSALPRRDITQKPAHHHLRARHKKSDPFRLLDAQTDGGGMGDAQTATSVASSSTDAAASKPYSMLMQLVLTPLHLITFILSLSLIDYRQRQWRLSQHPGTHQSDSLWSRVTHWSWLHPEPYQDSRDGTWKHNPTTAVQPAPADALFAGWFTQKKHGAVAKMAMDDAFAIRGRVLLALLAWTAVSLVVIVFIVRRLFAWALDW